MNHDKIGGFGPPKSSKLIKKKWALGRFFVRFCQPPNAFG